MTTQPLADLTKQLAEVRAALLAYRNGLASRRVTAQLMASQNYRRGDRHGADICDEHADCYGELIQELAPVFAALDGRETLDALPAIDPRD